jgi:hypothetical protein
VNWRKWVARLFHRQPQPDPVEQELALIEKKIEVEKAAQQSATITGEIMVRDPDTAPKGEERLRQAEERAHRVQQLERQREIITRQHRPAL